MILLERVRDSLRKWLVLTERDAGTPAWHHEAEEWMRELKARDAFYRCAFQDTQNTLQQIIALQMKFDVLVETLGVTIVGTSGGGDPKIISIRENGLLGDAKTYINAAQTVDRAVAIQICCLEEQAKLYAQIERKVARAETKALRSGVYG